MKITLSAVAAFLTLTSATRLCDNLLSVKTDLGSLSTTLSSNITTRAALNSAYMSLTHASTTLDKLNTQISQTTTAIDTATASLRTLDIETGCWVGWLENLGEGLKQVSATLRSIYQVGASDFQNGNFKNVQQNSQKLIQSAKDALDKLTMAQNTLNQYNNNVMCW